jgi:hypothetical protein
LPNGKLVSGHWEIHPVEKVESIDNKSAFKIGSSAQYVDPPEGGRYGLDDTDFPKRTVSNYAVLRGNVKGITKSTDQSGDFEITLGSKHQNIHCNCSAILRCGVRRIHADAQLRESSKLQFDQLFARAE